MSDITLTAATRANITSLQQTLKGLGQALDEKPTAADDAQQPASVRGLTGGQALNKTLDTSPQSLRDSAVVAQALVGPTQNDLARAIAHLRGERHIRDEIHRRRVHA